MDMRFQWSRAAVTVLLMIACAFWMTGAGFVSTAGPEKATKQVGGVSTDSSVVAADTSTYRVIPSNATAFWGISMGDSATSYAIQVSADTTNWYTIDFDTSAAGEADASADFGTTYNGFYVRVIADNLTLAGSEYHRFYFVVK